VSSNEPTPQGRLARAGVCLAAGLAIGLAPAPAAVEPGGWTLLAVFVAVILGFLLRPFPMGPTVLFGLLACALSGALDFTAVTSGYGEKVVWLVVGAFLLASAVRETGMGRRVALLLVRALGRSTLGLGYAQAAAELVLGPVVPSNTARGGGILAPICASLARALDSEPGSSPERAGAYLSLVGAHANLVTAAMFLTGRAANGLVAEAAQEVYGVEFGWADWALAASVPGLVALALLPPLLYAVVRPSVRDASAARRLAAEELARTGPWTRREKVMGGVFLLLLALWSMKLWAGDRALDTTLVAWLGVGVLVATGAHPWERMVRDHATWDTLIWLGGLLTLANGLRDHGVIVWFAATVEEGVASWPMLPTLVALALVYFYSMYGFSMLTAHISAMVGAFLVVCSGAGVPALLAVPLFAVLSNLCACTTHYSTGPVILYFGLGYVPVGTWFRVGFLVSLFHLATWLPLGFAWWRLLGWW